MTSATSACSTAARMTAPGPGEVRIVTVDLDATVETIDRLIGTLSVDERQRAARFRFRRDAARWIVARATLRRLLGECVDRDPRLLSFTYGPNGKPALSEPAGSSRLQFNLAHSAHLAVYALTVDGPIGVDVEAVRDVPDREQIAERTFSRRECAALRELPTELRAAGFFNCWTRKEAYIKAIGQGLSYPLDRFTVSLAPDEPARLLFDEAAAGRPEIWTMAALAPGPGFAGAVVVEARRSTWSTSHDGR